MDWRERAALIAESRAIIHDSFKIPVMLKSSSGAPWRAVFCRFHEASNTEGQDVGQRGASIVVDTDSPAAIFRHADAPDLAQGSVLSVSPGVAYTVHQAPPHDLYGYRTVKLKRALGAAVAGYPVPDWGAL